MPNSNDTKKQQSPRYWYIRHEEDLQTTPKHDIIPAGDHRGIICIAYHRNNDEFVAAGFGFCSPLSSFTRHQGRLYAGGRFRKYPTLINLKKGQTPKEAIYNFLEHTITKLDFPTTELSPNGLLLLPQKAAKHFPFSKEWYRNFVLPIFTPKVEAVAL